jgi:azurin
MAIRTLLCLCFFGLLPFMPVEIGLSQEGEPVTTITLRAVAGLQFDKVRIRVRPGTNIKVILKNEDDMSHNLVFTKPGKRMAVVNAALKLEEKGPEMDYIPRSADVLWSIPVLAPGEEKSITFTTPDEPGIYPYVCTFPGHGFSMYGTLYVTTDENLPDVTSDLNIPESRRKVAGDISSDKEKTHPSHGPRASSAHPYELKPPFLYRAYMENASPAAIAVRLADGLSYCWDAGTCELRYAWEGGFVDNTGLWKGKPNAVAKILGEVFFRIQARHPLRIGDPETIPVAAYKGYRLIDRYPEFHYTLNGLDVYELIRPDENGLALIRTFSIPEADENIWFCTHPEDGVRYTPSPTKVTNNRIRILPSHADKFTIVMTKKER